MKLSKVFLKSNQGQSGKPTKESELVETEIGGDEMGQ